MALGLPGAYGEGGCIPFSLKSFRPASSSGASSLVAAGNHPMILLESDDGGGVAKKDRANAGKDEDNGVGGSTR